MCRPCCCLFLLASLTVTSQQEVRSGPPEGKANDDSLQQSGARADQYGDLLPAGALARMGTVRRRHHDLIGSLALSPDGKILATAGTLAAAGGCGNTTLDHPIHLWDLTTGKELRQLLGHATPPSSVVFSPDGKTLISMAGTWTPMARYDHTVRLWDVATGKELHILRQHQPSPQNEGPGILAVAVSPDGKSFATSDQDGTIRIWDLATVTERRRCSANNHTPLCLAFSPDGQTLASGGRGRKSLGFTLCLWHVTTGEFRGGWSSQHNAIEAMRFGADGRTIVWQGVVDKAVHWWDRVARKERRQVPGSLLASTPDGKQLAIRDDRDIQLWDVVQAKELRRFRLPPGGYSTGVLSADGQTLIAADYHAVRLWDTRTGEERQPLEGQTSTVVFVGFTPDGKELITGGDAILRICDVETGKEVRQLRAHQQRLSAAALAADGRTLASAGTDGTVRVWDLPRCKVVRRLEVARGQGPHRGALLALAPDGSRLASRLLLSKEGGIRLWDLDTGEQLFHLVGGSAEPLAFSPDGKLLAELSPNAIVVYDLATGKRRWEVRGKMHSGGLQACALTFSPDGRIVATGNVEDWRRPCPVSLWELAAGKRVARLQGHRGPVGAVAFSPDGRVLASGSWDQTIRLWAVASGRELGRLQGHRGGIFSLAFSRDGRRLASGSSDTTALVWDVAALTADRGLRVAHLEPSELQALWTDLRAEDAAKAYRAVYALAAAPLQCVPFLEEHLRSRPPTRQRIQQLIADLEADRFEVREKASQELEGLGWEAEQALSEVLENRPSTEVRARVEELLAKVHRPGRPLSGLQLRDLRAVQVLEQIAMPEARKLLQSLARGIPKAVLTQEAKAAMDRLAKRAASAEVPASR